MFKKELMAFLEKLPDDEPVFILRAQDVIAGPLVNSWCDLAEALGSPATKVAEARSWAKMMKGWPVHKVPD